MYFILYSPFWLFCLILVVVIRMFVDSKKCASLRGLWISVCGALLGGVLYFSEIGSMIIAVVIWVFSFWILVYLSSFLRVDAVVDLKLPLAFLILVPAVSAIYILASDDIKFHGFLVSVFDQHLVEVFRGAASTAYSLEVNGLAKQSQSIKLVVAVVSPGWLFFGAWMLIAIFSSAGRVSLDGPVEDQVRVLKRSLWCGVILLFCLFLPIILMNFYTENCIGRRCGLERGYVISYLFWYCVSGFFVVSLLVSIIWFAMSCYILKSKERYINESER
jgi:hypothetical protein